MKTLIHNKIMIRKIKPAQPGRVVILAGLLLFLLLTRVINARELRQLTKDELNTELRKALLQNEEQQSFSIIKGNRLLIKPFVDALITESISRELKGKLAESKQLSTIAGKTAETFYKIFNERSLLIAVNYLTIWTKDQKEKKLIADSLYAIGTRIRSNAQDRDKAIEYHKKALDIYRNIGDERGESEVLGGLGLIYTSINYDTSLGYYKEALIKREKVDDRILVGNTLNSLGSLYYGIFQDYTLALNYFDRAEKVRRELGDSLNLGRTIHLKASTLQNLGETEQSLVYYKRSLRLNQNSGDQIRVTEALLNIGTILNVMGKYPEALENLEKAQKEYRILEDSTGISDSNNQIGFVYLNLGDLNAALEKFNEAISITKKLNDQWGLAGIYNNLGIMLQNAGRHEKALEYANDALKIYEDLKDQSSVIVSLNNIGTIYYDMKDYLKAEEYYQRGLKICRELKVKDQEANYLLNLANAQSLMGRMDEAVLNYQEGFEIARTLNSPDLTWKYIAGLAEYYETTGEYEKVIELNDTALKILEGLRSTLPGEEFKSTFMAKERYVFEDIIDLLETLYEKDRTKGYDKLAFLYAEQSKSRVLLDLLSAAKLISDNDPNKGNLSDPEPVSIDEAKALCPDKNTVVFEYSVGDSSSCLWVITRSDYKIFKLPRRKILQEQIETIRFSLLDPQQGISDFFTNAGGILYEELIKPAEPFLSKKSKLIIIPDGILNYLPFEVLLTENKKPTAEISYSGIPFLVKKYPVSYGQSASVLKTLISKTSEANKSKAISKRLFAFGDALYEDTLFNSHIKYPRLEFSGKEIENIASFFPGESSDIYLRNKATEENLKRNNELNKFNYIHFATHGLIDEDKPDLSSLVLTSEKNSGEDGFLQAAEIFNLKLDADLVVLSACQTGLGKLVRGEGMVGLTRAFMTAGTPSVVVSLWSVSDMSTALLMGEFYKNLIKNKLGKTDALRKAQLALMSDKKYSHPFYWAPFVLIGDWR
jgi:CHAT domain-containing protein/Tfp pilus assembly protein PilF